METSTPRVLWLGWEDAHTPIRMQQAAREQGVVLATLEVSDVSFITDGNQVGVFHQGQDLVKAYDILVARTFYPHISEALTVARLFHEAGKVVIDQSLTDEGYVISKMHDHLFLARHGIPVPRTWQVFDPDHVEALAQSLGYPCVLKGTHGSHGTHVYLVENAHQLRKRLQDYPAGELMLQEYLPAQEDYRLLVIGYHALPVFISRRPGAGDFRTNVAHSGETTAHTIDTDHELVSLAEQSARVLRREFAGVDIRYNGNKPVVLEVNRRPVFENFEHVTQYDVAGRFMAYVKDRFERHSLRQQPGEHRHDED
ncbi:MAG: ATP-grasp domain-containing protein [Chloroflexi bacterium]|nr:ATP-grasp domain-containing protein [Chloroflexota bacterium]